MNNEAASLRRSIWVQQLPLVLLLSALLIPLLPSWNLGFVSDDYGHLVEAARLPITSSTDALHRPLRNILFRLASAVFGLNPAPYHFVMIALDLILVALLYRFVLLLNDGRYAAFVAAAIFGFFPRSHQSLFWVAAAQDTVVGICALIACSAFLRYRRTGRWATCILALVSFSIALGFKETATAILPLLILLDATFGRQKSGSEVNHRWKAFLPFLIVTGLYLTWVLGDGAAQRYYGAQNFSQAVKLAAKFVLNMLVPFSSPVEVREVLGHIVPAIVVSLEVLIIAVASIALVRPRELSFAIGWIVIAMGPTPVFGFYTDRYILLPFAGLAVLLGFIAEAVVARAGTKKLAVEAAVVGFVCLYLFASIPCLFRYQASWREAAREVRATVNETRRLHPNVPNGSIFYFVNLTHSKAHGQVYVFNTSLNGALWAAGYDSSITGRRTFRADNSAEQRLVQQLLGCPRARVSDSTPGQYIFVFKETLIDVTGECSKRIIDSSRIENPELWK